MVTFWAYLRFHLLWGLRAPGGYCAGRSSPPSWSPPPRSPSWPPSRSRRVAAGRPPAKLWRAAAWALPMTGVYLAGRAVQARTWRALALAPVHDWEHAWHLAQAGQLVAAFVLCAPVGVPAALCGPARMGAMLIAQDHGLRWGRDR